MQTDKLIINAALTGMVPTQADNPNLPCTPEEIVADARRCRDAGASIVHVHARDDSGKPTYKKEIYAEIISGIRSECPDLLISGSTSGRLYRQFEQRSEVLDPGPGCRPDLGSLTLGSMNFPTGASVNEPQMIKDLALTMRRHGIKPEIELFDLGMVDYAHYLIAKGILAGPCYCNLLLGSLGTLAATPLNLATMARALPEDTVWSATGIGRFQFYVNCMAIAMGGHVRVGLEDNLYYDAEKQELATNAGLVERLVHVARAVGRQVATPDEVRLRLGLPARKRSKQTSIVALDGTRRQQGSQRPIISTEPK
ncbi:MAG: 3-keto-5-aminohexanoate cleavage protein [Sedimentisphaerales bacterium]|nr:3-keto-5-aminohexanoate cleavage protein [Sedimentisphaerales bacterium]